MLNSATVVHNGNTCSVSDLVAEIEAIGFDASVATSSPVHDEPVASKETVFGIIGMTCK
jgi:hypothetical protein